jgi:protein-tyrosine phosphatase
MSWSALTTHRPVGTTQNLRDLGGIPAADGRVIAQGRVYRSEALVPPGTTSLCAVWEPGHTPDYAALGVRTVLDLRTTAETKRTPSAWPDATGATYVSLPMDDGAEGDTSFVAEIRAGLRTRFTAADLAAFYQLTLTRRGPDFGTGLRVIADPARLPVLVHCAAGKDRTGLLVALLLEALGVSRSLVVDEYALTGTLRPDRVQAYAHLFTESGVDLADIAMLFDSPAEAMEATLSWLDETRGSVTAYLKRDCGLSPSELASLQSNLLL